MLEPDLTENIGTSQVSHHSDDQTVYPELQSEDEDEEDLADLIINDEDEEGQELQSIAC